MLTHSNKISNSPGSMSLAATEEKVVNLINNASLCNDEAQKVNTLKRVQELIIYKEPQLLDKYINDVLAFQNDKSIEVKKAIITFIEETCKKDPQNLSKVLGHINIMLRDGNAIIQKKIIQITTTFYKLFLEWVTKSKSSYITDTSHQIWIFMKNIKSYIISLQESENDGIRTQVIKFMEMIVLCQSCKSADSYKTKTSPFSLDDIPERHKFLRYLQLEEESKQIFTNMISLCGSITISHSNLNTLLGSLTDIALQRPQFMAKVIASFESLYSKIPPTLAKSQVSSVKKGLKNRFLSLIKHPSSFESQNKVINILIELGVPQNEITRNLPKMSKSNHLLNEISYNSNKKQRLQNLAHEALDQPTSHDAKKASEDNGVKADLYASLNPENVARLVMHFMPYLPESIPEIFVKEYKPITQAGSPSHISTLANLLFQKLESIEAKAKTETNDDTPNASVVPKKWGNDKIVPVEDMDVTKAKSTISFSQLFKKILITRDGGNQQPYSQHYDLIHKSVKLKEFLSEYENPDRNQGEGLCDPALMGNFNKLEQCRDAVTRLLETDWLLSDPQQTLAKTYEPFARGPLSKMKCHGEKMAILTKLAFTAVPLPPGPKDGSVGEPDVAAAAGKNLYGECIREVVIDYILEDLKGQYDLAVALLYKEYAQISKFGPSYEIIYDKFLSLLIETIVEKNEWKEDLLPRLLIESPLITEGVIDLLRSYCSTGTDNEFYLGIFVRMADLRPVLRKTLLTRLVLDFVSHPSNHEVRKNALNVVHDIYELKDYGSIIENYAIQYLSYLSLKSPPPPISSTIQLMKNCAPDTKADSSWTDETVKICLHLYLSILPINHKLIQNLFHTYIESTADIKRIILRSIETPIRNMGVDSTELMAAIKKCPKGAETLVTRIVHVLTGRGSRPNPSLVNVVRWLYDTKTVPDVRLLIPVLGGLSRDEILVLLPKFISLSSVSLIRDVLTRLVTVPSADDNGRERSILTPSELLVAFHMIPVSPPNTTSNNPPHALTTLPPSTPIRSTVAEELCGNFGTEKLEVEEGKVEAIEDGTCDTRILIRAIGLCFANKRIFSPEVLAITIESLVEVTPLPVLFMRLVIQSIVQYPQMIEFTIKILHELTKREVWEQKQAWIGFIKCCEKTLPHSLPVLIRLPAPELAGLLRVRAELKDDLQKYVTNLSKSQLALVSKEIVRVITDDVMDEKNNDSSDTKDLMESNSTSMEEANELDE